MSSFVVKSRQHWTGAVLLAIVIVESTVLLVIVGANFVANERYGGFQYGCPTLLATPVSSNSSVRWTRLGCLNGPALTLSRSALDCATRENPCTLIVPTFTPPDGLLALYTVDHSVSCPDDLHPSLGAFMWSGVSELYGWGNQATGLDYCAVTRTTVGTLAGFSVQWSLGPGNAQIPFIAPRAPVNVTVARGGTAMFVMNVTSRYSFDGIVSFTTGQVLRGGGGLFPPSFSFSPQSVRLRPGGSNSTTVTVQVSQNTSTGSWYACLNVAPVIGLNHYGDFGLASSTYGASTVIIDVT